jgi:hypothetical protein
MSVQKSAKDVRLALLGIHFVYKNIWCQAGRGPDVGGKTVYLSGAGDVQMAAEVDEECRLEAKMRTELEGWRASDASSQDDPGENAS